MTVPIVPCRPSENASRDFALGTMSGGGSSDAAILESSARTFQYYPTLGTCYHASRITTSRLLCKNDEAAIFEIFQWTTPTFREGFWVETAHKAKNDACILDSSP
jgi:hypothetical protein